MAGMYPPNGKQKWNGTNTSWQPIPIHTVSLSEDKVCVFKPINFQISDNANTFLFVL